MSRVGKQIIQIPEKTEVDISSDVLTVKGPLGELVKNIHPAVTIKVEGSEATVTPNKDTIEARSLWGTFASHVKNMVQGVNEAYTKKLVVEGVGFRVEVKGNSLVLNVGFSHPVELPIPEGLTVTVEKNVITISGSDKEVVGQFTAVIRSKKKPEPYKGKGIRYSDEVVRRKQGKKAVS